MDNLPFDFGPPLVGAVPDAGPPRGGRVRRTGIAVVHENERIYAAPGSEATVEPTSDLAEGTAIHYHFPVTVEVIGAMGDAEREQIVQEALGRLRQAVEGRVV